jgi:hypothetical protein
MPAAGIDFDTRQGIENPMRRSHDGWRAQGNGRTTQPLKIIVIETWAMAVIRKRVDGAAIPIGQETSWRGPREQESQCNNAHDRSAAGKESAAIFPLRGDKRHA